MRLQRDSYAQNRVHLMPPMSNFYARICVKATPSSNNSPHCQYSENGFVLYGIDKTKSGLLTD